MDRNMINKGKILKIFDFPVFTFPAFLFIMLSTIIPFLLNIYYSLFEWNGISKNMKFVGLNNFIRVLTKDPDFGHALLFTFKFTLFFVIIINILALFIALIISKKSILSNIGRSLYYIPHIVSLVAVSLIWKFLFGSGFDTLLAMTGLKVFGLSWVGDPKYVFYSLLIITIWQNLGFYLIIYIAGIIAVPTDISEAAEIDGASHIGKFVNITLPLIMPSIIVCVLLSITYALKLFDIILVFTRGGPAGTTITAAYDIYKEAFVRNNYGQATTKSLILFVAVLLFIIAQLRIFKKKEVEL